MVWYVGITVLSKETNLKISDTVIDTFCSSLLRSSILSLDIFIVVTSSRVKMEDKARTRHLIDQSIERN